MNNYTKIYINDLRLPCRIGLEKNEREKKQQVIINIEISINLKSNRKINNISETVDYYDIYLKIVHLIDNNTFHLVEQLAEQIIDIIMDHANVQDTTVKIAKPYAIKLAKSAGVEIKRSKI